MRRSEEPDPNYLMRATRELMAERGCDFREARAELARRATARKARKRAEAAAARRGFDLLDRRGLA